MGEMDGSAEDYPSHADVSLALVWYTPVHPYPDGDGRRRDVVVVQ